MQLEQRGLFIKGDTTEKIYNPKLLPMCQYMTKEEYRNLDDETTITPLLMKNS